MYGCSNKCMNGSTAHAIYSCRYDTHDVEGPHAPHDWFSYVYDGWMHCPGEEAQSAGDHT